jgi:hypothetical protein
VTTVLRLPHRRLVPPEWERQLAELSPQTNRFSWLKLVWEPGRPDAVIERFIVYQMIPAHAVQTEILEQLQRDLPPQGYYDDVLKEYVDEENCLITTRAWQLYRETQCWGRPYWVIQGTKGGHKRWFSETERKMLKVAGLPCDPPNPGELPYAEFDQRTLAALSQLDMLKGVHGTLRRQKALSPEGYAARAEAEERVLRERLLSWLTDQVAELTDGVSLHHRDERAENAADNYLETGRTHHGARLSLK